MIRFQIITKAYFGKAVFVEQFDGVFIRDPEKWLFRRLAKLGCIALVARLEILPAVFQNAVDHCLDRTFYVFKERFIHFVFVVGFSRHASKGAIKFLFGEAELAKMAIVFLFLIAAGVYGSICAVK